MTRYGYCRGVSGLVALLTATAAAFAQGPAVEQVPETARSEIALWMGHAESDNIFMVESPQRGSYDSLAVLLGLASESSRASTNLDLDLEFRNYSEEAIDDQLVGTFSGVADIDIVEERFDWTFEDYYSQGRTDALQAPSPLNREGVNVFSSGPRLDLPLGQRTSLALDANYRARRYENSSSLESDSLTRELSVLRQTTSTTQLGLILSNDEIEYDQTGVSAYEIDSVSLRYEKRFATGGVRAAIGRNELEYVSVEHDGPLYDFSWSRDIATRSTLTISAAREFTDSGSLFAPESGVPGDDVADVVLSPNPLERRQLGVVYSLASDRTEFSIGTTTLDDSYVGDPTLDNKAVFGTVSFSRALSPRTGLGVAFDKVRREYSDVTIGGEEEDAIATFWINYALGRQFDAAFVATRYERDGLQSFDETRYEVRFFYSPSDSATTALSRTRR
jgi:hypothetical protein